MFKRRRSEQDFANEIASHLEIETDRLIAQGMSPEDARYAARKVFGNVTTQTEHFHESRATIFVDAAWRHLRYAVRGLARRPAFAITAIVTLAFGIGVNSTLFTVLYALLLRAPAVGDPATFVNVIREVHDDGRPYHMFVKGRASMLSWPDYQRLRTASRTVAQLAVYRDETLTLDIGDRPSAISAEFVSCNFFATTRIAMTRGRPFLPDECANKGTGNVTILSYANWQRRFGSDPNVIGQSIMINRHAFTIIGVAARGFAGLEFQAVDAWVPVTMYGALLPSSAGDFDQDVSWLAGIARLNTDATASRAAAELTSLQRAEDARWPGRVSRIQVKSGARVLDAEDQTVVLAAASGVTFVGGLILLMCCANVMNLLLARASARRREIGIRLSLGASRARLIVQLMVESGVMAFVGAAVGWRWRGGCRRSFAPPRRIRS